MRPVIGLTVALDAECTTTSPNAYSQAIELAGGLPVLLPYTEDPDMLSAYLGLCDGFFFTGGADVDPTRYGEEILPVCGELQVQRDAMEFSLLSHVLPTEKPILGVCRGTQLINAALGGTLYQDIPSQLQTTLTHRQLEPKFAYSHAVDVLPNTPLSALIGTRRIAANSFHHQAIKAIGDGLAVMATAEDGVIEALYHTAHPYMRLYQWHPERLCDRDEVHLAPFVEFIAACRNENGTHLS